MRTPMSRRERIALVAVLLGLFAALALFVYPGVVSGRFLRYRTLELHAPDAAGLLPGDRVVARGIQVGEVTALALAEEDGVRISIRIHPDYAELVREGLRAEIVPPPLVGSPRVRLTGGAGRPLEDGTAVEAALQPSIVERVGSLADVAAGTIRTADRRLEDLGRTLAELERALSALTEGKGALGKLLNDPELYERANELLVRFSRIPGRVDEALSGFDDLRERIEPFAATLDELRDDIRTSAVSLRRALTRLEEGLERFPETAAEARVTIEEARRVVESLKRNVLIRANLPESPPGPPLPPATFRERPGRASSSAP